MPRRRRTLRQATPAPAAALFARRRLRSLPYVYSRAAPSALPCGCSHVSGATRQQLVRCVMAR